VEREEGLVKETKETHEESEQHQRGSEFNFGRCGEAKMCGINYDGTDAS
jgi:hypothetical protein